MINIPYDIWCRIAHFLPPDVLRNLYSVNRPFFDLAMNNRYRNVEFLSASRETIQMLDCLRNPAVAARVRCFNIRPSIIEEIRSSGVLPRILSFKFPAFIHAALTSRSSKDIRSAHQISQAFVNIISNLSQLTEYTIFWRVSRKLSQKEYTSPRLLAAVRSVFTPTLKRLTLHLSVDVLQSLLEKPSQLEFMGILETFDVTVYASTFDTVETNGDPLVDFLCPFICSLSSSLQRLSISILCHIDPSLLFKGLGHLPQLNWLDLYIVLDVDHFPDSSFFERFLNNHAATLQHLSLKSFQCRLGAEQCKTYTAGWNTWGRQALSGVVLPRLRSLTLDLKLLSEDQKISNGLPSLSGFADSLTSLTIVERYCTFEDVQALANSSISSNLTDLTLRIQHLSPQLMDALAQKFPQLHRLNMSVLDVISCEGAAPVLMHDPGRVKQDQREVELFHAAMRTRQYPAWGLVHLRISCMAWCDAMPRSRHWEVISQCVPSLSRTQ